MFTFLYKTKNLTYLLAIAFFLFLFPMLADAATLRKPPNNLGLVGYWSMEDGEGTSATDFSGSGNTGTLNGSMTDSDWVSGRVGTALDFDGTDDRITISDDNSLDITEAITISLWVYPRSLGTTFNFSALVGKDWRSAYGFFLDNSIPAGLTFLSNNNGVSQDSNSNVIELNVWQHVVVRYDKANVDFYVDGVDVGGGAETASLASNAKDLLIGRDYEGGTEDYEHDGLIDEVRVYNRALSVSEIQDLYESSASSKINISRELPEISDLVGWWTLDGSSISGTSATDDSGNGNSGTLNGGADPAAGRVGQAISFDGVNDYIDAGTAASLQITGDLTISVWVNADALSNDAALVNVQTDGETESTNALYQLAFNNNADLKYFHEYGAGNNELLTFNTNLDTSTWYHLTVTRDISSNEIKLFIDGSQFGVTQNFTNDPTGGTSAPFVIGKNVGSDTYFDGLIDDVRVYDRVLTESEIQRIYNATRPSTVNSSRTDRLTDGLIGYWSFDGPNVDLSASLAEVKDSSGNSNDGDAVNGAAPAIGKIGQGYTFDGVDDYVNAGTGIAPSSEISICAWLYRRTDGSVRESDDLWQDIIVRSGTSNGSSNYHFEFNQGASEAQPSLLFGAGGNFNVISTTDSETNQLNTWNHLCVSYSNADGGGIYTNGDLKASVGSGGTDLTTTSQNLFIGGRSGSSDIMDGIIDEVRIYDRTLSAEEIKQLYRMGQ